MDGLSSYKFWHNARVTQPKDQPSNSSKRKRSSVRHTRAVQHDRSQRPISVQNEKSIEAVLKEIVHL
jgi:hypothetical protein